MDWTKTTLIIVVIFIGIVCCLFGYFWYNTSSELSETKIELTITQDKLDTVQETLTTAENSLSVTQERLEATEKELANTTTKLEEIQEKYPLNTFASELALSSWASTHTKSYDWYDALDEFQVAAEIANEAMLEGYLVWIDYDNVSYGMQTYCIAFVGNQMYWWFPHTTYYDGIHKVAGLYK